MGYTGKHGYSFCLVLIIAKFAIIISKDNAKLTYEHGAENGTILPRAEFGSRALSSRGYSKRTT